MDLGDDAFTRVEIIAVDGEINSQRRRGRERCENEARFSRCGRFLSPTTFFPPLVLTW
jgi:hypothetical protein